MDVSRRVVIFDEVDGYPPVLEAAPPTCERIEDTSETFERVEPGEFAAALGAEPCAPPMSLFHGPDAVFTPSELVTLRSGPTAAEIAGIAANAEGRRARARLEAIAAPTVLGARIAAVEAVDAAHARYYPRGCPRLCRQCRNRLRASREVRMDAYGFWIGAVIVAAVAGLVVWALRGAAVAFGGLS